MKSISFFLLFPSIASIAIQCTNATSNISTEEIELSKSEIVAVLNSWHLAAAKADATSYFEFFENDDSIFMGTDDTERWNVKEFEQWSKPYFDKGKAWEFTGFDRHIYIGESGKIAWFDERLNTPNLGPCRGTGVLKKVGKQWKISHYNLSIPVPNEIQPKVTTMISGFLSKQGK